MNFRKVLAVTSLLISCNASAAGPSTVWTCLNGSHTRAFDLTQAMDGSLHGTLSIVAQGWPMKKTPRAEAPMSVVPEGSHLEAYTGTSDSDLLGPYRMDFRIHDEQDSQGAHEAEVSVSVQFGRRGGENEKMSCVKSTQDNNQVHHAYAAPAGLEKDVACMNTDTPDRWQNRHVCGTVKQLENGSVLVTDIFFVRAFSVNDPGLLKWAVYPEKSTLKNICKKIAKTSATPVSITTFDLREVPLPEFYDFKMIVNRRGEVRLSVLEDRKAEYGQAIETVTCLKR